jgi:hypothetical protein
MKKVIKTAIATAITALSINAHAEYSSPFTYLEYSMGNIQYDANRSDGDYSALSGSIEVPLLLLPILSAELVDFDDIDITKLGTGSYLMFGEASYIYALAHYNDYDNDNIDNDLSFTVGLSHAFIYNNLEARLSYTSYTDNDYFDGIKASLSYHFHPNFSVSGNYQSSDDYNIISAGVKVSF